MTKRHPPTDHSARQAGAWGAVQPLQLFVAPAIALLVGCASEPVATLTADGPGGTAARGRYDACVARTVQSVIASGKRYSPIHLAKTADGFCAESAIGLEAAIVVDNKNHRPALAQAFAAAYVRDYRSRVVEYTAEGLIALDKR